MVTGDLHIYQNRERFQCVCLVVFKWPIQRFQPCELKKVGVSASLWGVRGHPSPGKNFKICANKMPFPEFWDKSQWEYCAQNYRRLMVGCQKSKNERETTKRRIIKSLVKKRNGRVSKTGRISSENWRFPAKTGGFNLCQFSWLISVGALIQSKTKRFLSICQHSPISLTYMK